MTATTGIEDELLDLLAVFIIAAGVGVFVAKGGRFPYTIALLLAGLAVSIVGYTFEIELSRDLLLLVLLPPLLFEGAATTDLEQFRRNLVPIVALAVPGLIVSIFLLGWLGTYALGLPLLVALKIDQVEMGESTVRADRMGEEAYREFWRTGASEYGLETAIEDGSSAGDA